MRSWTRAGPDGCFGWESWGSGDPCAARSWGAGPLAPAVPLVRMLRTGVL